MPEAWRCDEHAGLLAARPGLEAFAPPQCNILLFRCGRDSALQDRVRQRIVRDGDFYFTRTTVRGEAWLRLVIRNPFTGEEDLTMLAGRVEAVAAVGRSAGGGG